MPKCKNDVPDASGNLSMEQLLQIVETNPTSTVVLNSSGKIIFANRQAEKVLGLKVDVITRRTYNDQSWRLSDFAGNPYPNNKLPFAIVRKTKKSVSGVRFAVQRPPGKRIFLSAGASPIFDARKRFMGVVTTFENITEEVVTKQALEQSEARYRQLFNRISSGVAIYGAVENGEDFVIKDFNRAAERIDSVKKEEILGSRVTRVFPGVREFGLLGILQQVYKTGKQWYHPVTMYKDERISGWRENYVYKLPSGEVVAVYDDRTKDKQAEISIRESEARLKRILQAAPIGIGVEHNRMFTWANPMLYSMTGYSEGELKGKSARLLYLSDQEYDFVGREKYHRIGPREKETVETVWRRKNGKLIDVLLSFTALDIHDPAMGVIFTALDITRRKQLQEKLRQSEKMLALGQLAGGIAHDFNNQLLGILCYVELLKDESKNSPLLQEYTTQLLRITESASELVNRLLSFSRRSKSVSVSIDVHKLLADVVSLLRHTISKRIIIKQNLLAVNSTLHGDPSQLQNIFLNLALNARDAMPDGGELVFSTEQVYMNARLRKKYHTGLSPGPYILIRVSDTGRGIDREIKEHIFEPFFTTKEQGKGIGMGLASVQGTVKTHRGDITVSSLPERGTTFNIFFPL